MGTSDQLDRKREAQRRIRAQRLRVRTLRTRAITISLLCFALLWAVVFVQMATGNDPVLGAGRRVVGEKAAQPENRTDSEEAGGAGARLAETVETTSPEENDDEAAEPIDPEAAELEAIEREAAELEAIELEAAELEAAELEAIEAEPEPVPVETAQS